MPFLERKEKKLEVRIANRFTLPVKVGHTIVFGGTVTRTVKAIRRYRDFEAMLSHENADEIWSGASADQVLKLLEGISPPKT